MGSYRTRSQPTNAILRVFLHRALHEGGNCKPCLQAGGGQVWTPHFAPGEKLRSEQQFESLSVLLDRPCSMGKRGILHRRLCEMEGSADCGS